MYKATKMCTGSVHAKHRRAKDKERLVIEKIPGHGGYKGYYPMASAKDAGLLVCVRGMRKAIIKKVVLEQGAAPLFSKYNGQRNVPVTLVHVSSGDYVRFAGQQMHLSLLAVGTRIDIGIPVRKRAPKAAGIVVIEKAIKEVMSTPPQPRPEDQPTEQPAKEPGEQPTQPAEQPAPTPQPQRQPEQA